MQSVGIPRPPKTRRVAFPVVTEVEFSGPPPKFLPSRNGPSHVAVSFPANTAKLTIEGLDLQGITSLAVNGRWFSREINLSTLLDSSL